MAGDQADPKVLISRIYEEVKKIYIEPGRTIRLWIGLDHAVPQEDLGNKRRTSQPGTSMLPIALGSKTAEWRQEL